jgi:hypothetical protein
MARVPAGSRDASLRLVRIVRLWNEVRQGFAVVYISEPELERPSPCAQSSTKPRKTRLASTLTRCETPRPACSKNAAADDFVCARIRVTRIVMSPLALYDNSKPE